MIVWVAFGQWEGWDKGQDLLGIAHSRSNAEKMCRDNPNDEGGNGYDQHFVQRWLLGSTTRKGELEVVK